MLHPSYSELMEKINKDVADGGEPVVQSRYSIVKAAAARAKQIIEARAIDERCDKIMSNNALSPQGGLVLPREDLLAMRKGKPLIENADDRKPLSVAVDELYDGVVKIVKDNEDGGQ